MTPDKWRAVERFYLAALERDPGERAAFLDSACASDEELRREVESLLEYQPKAEAFLEPVGSTGIDRRGPWRLRSRPGTRHPRPAAWLAAVSVLTESRR